MSLWENKDAEPWDQNVPPDLISAIKHLHDIFQLAHTEFGLLVTMPLCYSRLHNGAHKSGFTDIAEYEKALAQLQMLVGSGPTQRFRELVSRGTLPAIFKGFLDFYLDGTCLRARFVFKQLLEIGRANENRLSCGQVEWAEAQTKYMIRYHRHSIRLWVQYVCDEHVHDPQEDSEERVYWRKWQAPAFLIMKPAYSLPYDAVRVWERQSPETSSQWLESFADHYVIKLEAAIRGEAGQARVEEAKRPKPKTDTSFGELQRQTQTFTWKELEGRFQNVHANGLGKKVSADFISTEWDSGQVSEEWTVSGDPICQNDFKDLASIAARKLGCMTSEVSDKYWLNHVRKWLEQTRLENEKSVAWRPTGTVNEWGKVGKTQGLFTERIAELSAKFCVNLISRGTPESAVLPQFVGSDSEITNVTTKKRSLRSKELCYEGAALILSITTLSIDIIF